MDGNDGTGHFNREQGYDYDNEDSERYYQSDDMYPKQGQDTAASKKLSLPRNYSYVLNDNGDYERIIRKRKRKSQDQLKTLMREFDKTANWTKETLLDVSKKTGLSEA